MLTDKVSGVAEWVDMEGILVKVCNTPLPRNTRPAQNEDKRVQKSRGEISYSPATDRNKSAYIVKENPNEQYHGRHVERLVLDQEERSGITSSSQASKQEKMTSAYGCPDTVGGCCRPQILTLKEEETGWDAMV